jgi:hypothetical protein
MRCLLALAFVLSVAGCKGDPQKCETACRHYAELVYWDNAEKEIAGVPAEKRDELRKQKMAELSRKLADGIDMCVSQCVSANNKDDMECMTTAKTAKEVKACTTK